MDNPLHEKKKAMSACSLEVISFHVVVILHQGLSHDWSPITISLIFNLIYIDTKCE